MRASVSQIKQFKACRRAWYFKYHEKLMPVESAEPLETGRSYHQYLEALEDGVEPGYDFSKAAAMAKAYEKYILPKFKVVATEKEYEKIIGNHTLHGFVDGIADDGCIVEHKTTSRDISEGGEYEYNLLWDEQVLAYMSLTGARKVYYTVCRKPTIRLKKDESEEDFFDRMVAWYDEDTDSKIRMFVVERTDAEIAQFEQDFEAICDEMDGCKNTYRNCLHCNSWGRRCEYSSICLNYNPDQQYIEFTKGDQSDGGGEEF